LHWATKSVLVRERLPFDSRRPPLLARRNQTDRRAA
jgi:hypothetical protein